MEQLAVTGLKVSLRLCLVGHEQMHKIKQRNWEIQVDSQEQKGLFAESIQVNL